MRGKFPKRSVTSQSRLPKIRRINLEELGRRYDSAFERRDLEECKRIVEEVLRVNPGNVDAHLQKARLYGVMCRFEESRRSFQKAVELASPESRLNVASKAGSLSRDLYDPSIAEKFFAFSAQDGGPIEALLYGAEHLDRMRRRGQAIECVELALQRDPQNSHAQFLKAKFGATGDSEAESILRALANRSDIPLEIKARAGYELGHYLDRIGDYDGAMQVLLAAKLSLQSQSEKYLKFRPMIRQKFIDFSNAITPEVVERWRAQRYKPLTGLKGIGMIAGHPRSGTTLIEQILDSHSTTESAEETETFSIFGLAPLADPTLSRNGDLFGALDSVRASSIENARKAYRRTIGKTLSLAPTTNFLIDKNPSLSPLIGAFFRVFPEVRILTMIRDPRDVILSCFFQPMFPVNQVTASFTTLPLAAEEYSGTMDAYARSAAHLGDSVLEVRYEDLVNDVEGVSRGVLDFYGLPWEEQVLDFHRRAQERVVRSPTADAVTERIHKRATQRWRHYERYLEPCFGVLKPHLERWGYE